MSRPDALASAALGEQIIRPVFLAFLDFADEPVRANSSGVDFTPSGSGDPDLDGHPFLGISPDFCDISTVKVGGGGSDTVTAELSGLPGLDEEMLDQLGNRANWQGREARLWRIIRDETNTQRGAIQHYYTGYMTALDIKASADEQKIIISIESYLAAFSGASNRTYLDQERFDPGDLSARAAIAIANGTSGNPIVGNTPTVGSGLGGMWGRLHEFMQRDFS